MVCAFRSDGFPAAWARASNETEVTPEEPCDVRLAPAIDRARLSAGSKESRRATEPIGSRSSGVPLWI
jgi:hypothetical protein